jgi:hypothetical protein
MPARPGLGGRYRGADCWTVGSSPGSWRCMTAGSLIYDPCFEAAPVGGVDRVFCPLAPWRKTVAKRGASDWIKTRKAQVRIAWRYRRP